MHWLGFRLSSFDSGPKKRREELIFCKSSRLSYLYPKILFIMLLQASVEAAHVRD